MKHSDPIPTSIAGIVGVPVGACAGLVFGFCLAAAKLMGDAEIYPPDQLPPAPSLLIYLSIGTIVGVVLTPILFVVSWKTINMIRQQRNKQHHSGIAR